MFVDITPVLLQFALHRKHRLFKLSIKFSKAKLVQVHNLYNNIFLIYKLSYELND